jgi:hypothetical protein
MTTFSRESQTTKDKIEASLDYAPVLELFDNNFNLDNLSSQLEAYKMSRNKKNTPPRQQAGGALKYSYCIVEEDEGRNDDTYAKQSFHNKDALSSPPAQGASSGTRQMAGVVGFPALYTQPPPQGKPS